jgi:hypothetical protein
VTKDRKEQLALKDLRDLRDLRDLKGYFKKQLT